MRILHILDHSIPLHSGYAFRTRAILQQQRQLGWSTFHLTSPKHTVTPVDEETVEGFHFYRMPAADSWTARLPVVKYVQLMAAMRRRLHMLARELRPDVLHAHSPVLNALPAISVGRALGIPVVYEVRAFWEDAAVDHGTAREGSARYRLSRAVETFALRRAAAVTTICEGLRAEIVSRGIPEAKVTVIPNAVDVERFSVSGGRDITLASEIGVVGKVVLGFIGSFYAYEGLPLLLEAIALIRARHPDIVVLLVGGGPDEPRLRKRVHELGIAESVVFVGRVPHDQIVRYYDLIDIFVYPRYSMRLTELVTPLKPLEAMAQARLVVASDVGGHRELIRDSDTGVLFAAGDAGALAARLSELLATPSRWAALRQAARRFVEAERTWPISVSRYRAVYEPLVTAQRRERSI
jgi:PEP-CTERM/exosortase A-associated glycosyltransferase